jgi:hypothetical protein
MSTQISQNKISQALSSKTIHDKVLNPETKRYIKINGKIFNTLVSTNFTYDSNNKVLSPSQDYASAVSDKSIINPLTNRKIKIGGKIYLELLKSCTYDTETNTLNLIDKISNESDEKVINPLTNRKVKIGGKVYLELLKSCTYDTETNTLNLIDVKEESDIENEEENSEQDNVTVINPLTNRKIKIGGKICEGLTHIINPNTNRKIKVGGKAYLELLQSL